MSLPYPTLLARFATEQGFTDDPSKLNVISPAAASAAFAAFIRTHEAALRSAVCPRWLRFRRNSERQEEIEILAGISDAVSGAITGVTPTLVAVLIFRYGIDRICQYYT
jgi:hypothetical protein